MRNTFIAAIVGCTSIAGLVYTFRPALDRTAADPADPDAIADARDAVIARRMARGARPEDEQQAFGTGWSLDVRLARTLSQIRAFELLDHNADGELDTSEIHAAPDALLALDLDDDGSLGTFELDLSVPPSIFGPQTWAEKVLRAIDPLDDGLEPDELAALPERLLALDIDNDGLVTLDDLVSESDREIYRHPPGWSNSGYSSRSMPGFSTESDHLPAASDDPPTTGHPDAADDAEAPADPPHTDAAR